LRAERGTEMNPVHFRAAVIRNIRETVGQAQSLRRIDRHEVSGFFCEVHPKDFPRPCPGKLEFPSENRRKSGSSKAWFMLDF
jgi:hypothetical protein